MWGLEIEDTKEVEYEMEMGRRMGYRRTTDVRVEEAVVAVTEEVASGGRSRMELKSPGTTNVIIMMNKIWRR